MSETMEAELDAEKEEDEEDAAAFVRASSEGSLGSEDEGSLERRRRRTDGCQCPI